jgi:hypothetical protein
MTLFLAVLFSGTSASAAAQPKPNAQTIAIEAVQFSPATAPRRLQMLIKHGFVPAPA